MNELPGDREQSPGSSAPEDTSEDLVATAVEEQTQPSEAMAFLKELPFLIVGALIVAVLVKTFLIQVFWIPSASMEETLDIGDRVIVNKISYRFGDPGRGDVVVFEPETFEEESIVTKISRNLLESVGLRTPESDLIKRVIGLPGETVEIRDSTVLIDGTPLREPYLAPDLTMRDEGPWEVPAGQYFVMGDNRNSSNDSRRFGAINRDRIVGKAFSIVWPPSHWAGL